MMSRSAKPSSPRQTTQTRPSTRITSWTQNVFPEPVGPARSACSFDWTASRSSSNCQPTKAVPADATAGAAGAGVLADEAGLLGTDLDEQRVGGVGAEPDRVPALDRFLDVLGHGQGQGLPTVGQGDPDGELQAVGRQRQALGRLLDQDTGEHVEGGLARGHFGGDGERGTEGRAGQRLGRGGLARGGLGGGFVGPPAVVLAQEQGGGQLDRQLAAVAVGQELQQPQPLVGGSGLQDLAQVLAPPLGPRRGRRHWESGGLGVFEYRLKRLFFHRFASFCLN